MSKQYCRYCIWLVTGNGIYCTKRNREYSEQYALKNGYIKNCRARLYDGTYEAVGEHFQGNPYGLSEDRLIRHEEVIIDCVPRTFEGIKEYLSENYIEGIVFWLDGEPIAKIKRSDFGLPWNTK